MSKANLHQELLERTLDVCFALNRETGQCEWGVMKSYTHYTNGGYYWAVHRIEDRRDHLKILSQMHKRYAARKRLRRQIAQQQRFITQLCGALVEKSYRPGG